MINNNKKKISCAVQSLECFFNYWMLDAVS